MQRREDAISPVIGVMLMLVVTIIIAAIVAAFAGGTTSGTQKAPQATISGTYSQSNGMTITHNGGDAIPLETTTILVRPGKAFGSDAAKYSWVVNKSYIFANSTQDWASARAFLPGDTGTISTTKSSVTNATTNMSFVQQEPDMANFDDHNADYGFATPNNVGLSFELLFVDSSGNTIARTIVPITG